MNVAEMATILASPEALAAAERVAKTFLSAGAGAWATMAGCDVALDGELPVCARRGAFVEGFGVALVTDMQWSGDHEGRLWFVVESLGARAIVAHMMALMMGTPADPATTTMDDEGLDAYTEAVNSLAGQGAQALRGELERAIRLTVSQTRSVDFSVAGVAGEVFGSAEAEALGVMARLRFGEGESMRACLFFDPACVGHSVGEPATPTATITPAAEDGFAPDNLEHALRLRVPLVVILAARKMRMELIQEMAPGTIIEFRKQSGEPLDVYANNVKIANAEVVTTNQHFGVQIRQVIDPRVAAGSR